MAWVPLHESTFAFELSSHTANGGHATRTGSTIDFSGYPPASIGFNDGWLLTFPNDSHYPTRLRASITAFASAGPNTDQFYYWYNAGEFSEANSSGVVGQFAPNPFEADLAPGFEGHASFGFSVQWQSNVTHAVFEIEVWQEEVPVTPCFWTDRENCTEACAEDTGP